VPGKLRGAETTPFMKVIYSNRNFSVSASSGSILIIFFAIRLNVNYAKNNNKKNKEFRYFMNI
jgi:hypothetical protein